MAAFPTPAAAVACALEIHADVAGFNATVREPLRLKVGLHAGPCIAVRSSDDRLDYFGGTVNLAARTHEQSGGEDVVLTGAVLADPEAAALLSTLRCEAFVADLRGLGTQTLYRFYPDAAPRSIGGSSQTTSA
jgi:class 3 adenylate cyclase